MIDVQVPTPNRHFLSYPREGPHTFFPGLSLSLSLSLLHSLVCFVPEDPKGRQIVGCRFELLRGTLESHPNVGGRAKVSQCFHMTPIHQSTLLELESTTQKHLKKIGQLYLLQFKCYKNYIVFHILLCSPHSYLMSNKRHVVVVVGEIYSRNDHQKYQCR